MIQKGEEQEFLDALMYEMMGDEYNHYVVTFMGYENLGSHTYGNCVYYTRTRCLIHLGEKYPWDERPLFREAVLYHEACHAKLYLEDGKNDGHNKNFRDLRRKKIKYWFADIWMKLVWCAK